LPGLEGPRGETGPIGLAGPIGPQGAVGPAGRSTETALVDEQGQLVNSYSDGTSAIVGKVLGPAGKDGKDGAPGLNGKDGKTGPKGQRGLQGPKGSVGAPGSIITLGNFEELPPAAQVLSSMGLRLFIQELHTENGVTRLLVVG